MPEFKTNISNPKTGKSYKMVISGQNYNTFIGKKIGDEVDGVFVSLPGYKLKITGGSDENGFPMRNDFPGGRKRRIMLSKSTGFHPDREGKRKKKSVRGNTVTNDIFQINLTIVKHGSKSIDDLINQKEE